MEELISVIVPVYNVGAYLRQCMDSIVRQTYRRLEIIAINDGSTDDSLSILKAYASSDSRITILSKENAGLMAAWMDGLNMASGDWIMFVDSDDWLELSIVERLRACQCESGADVVVAASQLESLHRKPRKYGFRMEPGLHRMSSELFARIINDQGECGKRVLPINRWGKLIHKNLLLQNLKYCDTRISYAEDVNIMVPVLGEARLIHLVDESLYHYRMNPSSITHSYIEGIQEQINALYACLFRYAQDTNRNASVFRALNLDYAGHILFCVKRELTFNGLFCGVRGAIRLYSNDSHWADILTQTDTSRFSLPNRMLVAGIKARSYTLLLLLAVLLRMKKALVRVRF